MTTIKSEAELDKILTHLENSVAIDVSRRMIGGRQSEAPKVAHARAKQAITSLIKELVAEAKPEEYEDYYATNPVEKGRKMGYNEAAREFEQNLLKVLSSSGKE